jgi:NADH dehydrogenase
VTLSYRVVRDGKEALLVVPEATLGKLAGSKRPKVVIAGAGFGGLETARALREAPVDVTLIDRRNFHLFQPLLYQVATAVLSPGDIAWPIRSIFRKHENVRVVMAELTGIDLQARTVTDGSAILDYDFLVVATGATHSYFGHDSWSAHAPGLKRISDATSLRERVLRAFERAELAQDAVDQMRDMTIVVIGGGPTGVELAGAMAELLRKSLAREFRRIDSATARVILIEAGPRLLATFPERLSAVTRKSLETMGVEVRTGTAVTDCDEGGVTLASGERIETATIAWAAGVTASPAASWLGAEHDRAGRVRVDSQLSVPGHPEVFVIGDTAAVDGVPGLAPAAKQMGRYAGKLIAARVSGSPGPAPFRYRHSGDLATIGRKSAVVSFGRIQLTGFAGWLFWSLIHIMFLIGFRSRIVVALNWIWSFLTFQRSARLISDRPTGN